MTLAEREAAEGLYRALSLMPCTCVRMNAKTVTECLRCAAMWQWERVVLERRRETRT